MTETTVNTSTKLSYTDDDVSRDVQRKLFAEGWYALLLTSNFADENKTGSLRFTQKFAVLEDPTDHTTQSAQKILNYMTLPFDNPKKPLAKLPDTLGICYSQLKALGGDVGGDLPKYPHKVDGVLTFEGSEISKDDYKECQKKVSRATRDRLIDLHEEPSSMEGHSCWGYVEIDGEYNRITRFRSELPEGEEPVARDQWFVRSTEEN